MLHMSTSVFQDAVGPQKISTDSETTNLVHIYIYIFLFFIFICIINLYDISNKLMGVLHKNKHNINVK